MAIYRGFVEKFADELKDASIERDKIIAFRGALICSRIEASERREDYTMLDVLSEVFQDKKIKTPLSLFTTEQLSNQLRVAFANLRGGSFEPEDVIANIVQGNPYYDVARATHPSARVHPAD